MKALILTGGASIPDVSQDEPLDPSVGRWPWTIDAVHAIDAHDAAHSVLDVSVGDRLAATIDRYRTRRDWWEPLNAKAGL